MLFCEMMDRDVQIAVIGAGLGGLTAAALLQREGFRVTVFEQAETFSRIGAGIILSANVTKSLRRLGLEPLLLRAGIKADSFVSRASDTGEILYEMFFDAAAEARFGAPYLNIHRGDLHAILESAVDPSSIRLGYSLRNIEQYHDSVRVTFENGEKVETNIVLGADGIRSRVREHVLGSEPPRFVGRVAQRAIFPATRLSGYQMRDCTKWWAPDRHILTYFLTSRRDEVYVIGTVPASGWYSESAWLPSSRDELVTSFQGFHEDLRRVVEAALDVTLWPIYDRDRNDVWSAGHAVLMGDACHPVRPYMAAGGAMAIEDAVILTRCLTRFDEVSQAFAAYAATRIPRVAEVQRISFENSWMHGPTDPDWFFCYDPWVTPLSEPAAAESRPAAQAS
jgi:6-hydroxynicotinate 3-monooxygenase